MRSPLERIQGLFCPAITPHYPSMRLFFTSCCIVAFVISFCGSLSAQTVYRPGSQISKDSQKFWDEVWYGAGGSFGFASSNSNSELLIGLFPMAGYHLTDQFSVGLRTGLSYTYTKIRVNSGLVESFNLFDIAAGPLARFKLFYPFFAHGEVEFASDEFVFFDGGNYVSTRRPQTNVYLGAGYGGEGFELLVLYNFSENTQNSINIPIVFRAAFTFNYWR